MNPAKTDAEKWETQHEICGYPDVSTSSNYQVTILDTVKKH
jgi:hypothetical protein